MDVSLIWTNEPRYFHIIILSSESLLLATVIPLSTLSLDLEETSEPEL